MELMGFSQSCSYFETFSSFIEWTVKSEADSDNVHRGKADDRYCNYGHPKMADMKLGKNLFCRLHCFYNVF